MIQIQPEEITGSVFERIGKQWMLLTAGDARGQFNTMTASWGGFGVMWGKPVAFCVVRPQRYTFGFMEAAERYTLSFYPETCRDALNLCGARSGRDTDKPAAAGLTPARLDSGAWTFEQAEITVECKKLYADMLKEGAFTGSAEIGQFYPNQDFHKLYIGSVEAVYKGH